MPLTTLQPGDKGADFVALTDQLKAWLLAEDIRFVIRYVVPSNYTRIGKDYRAWETDWYAEHGIAVLSNFERHATDAMGGAAKGAANGRVAADLTADFGFPVDAPLFCSVDQAITTTNIDVAEEYVRAFAAEIAPYPLGIYGGDVIAHRCRDLNPVFWKAAARSWSRGIYPVHVQQHLQVNGNVDPNTVRAPFTAWDPGGTTTPPPEVDDMQVRTLVSASPDGSGATYCLETGHQISGPVRKAWRDDPNVHLVEVYGDAHAELVASCEHIAGQSGPEQIVVDLPDLPGATLVWDK